MGMDEFEYVDLTDDEDKHSLPIKKRPRPPPPPPPPPSISLSPVMKDTKASPNWAQEADTAPVLEPITAPDFFLSEFCGAEFLQPPTLVPQVSPPVAGTSRSTMASPRASSSGYCATTSNDTPNSAKTSSFLNHSSGSSENDPNQSTGQNERNSDDSAIETGTFISPRKVRFSGVDRIHRVAHDTNVSENKIMSTAMDLKEKLQRTIEKVKKPTKEAKTPKSRNMMPKSGTRKRRSSGSRRSNGKRISPDQVKILEAKFALTPQPSPSEYLEIKYETNLDMATVKYWFRYRMQNSPNCSRQSFNPVQNQAPSEPHEGNQETQVDDHEGIQEMQVDHEENPPEQEDAPSALDFTFPQRAQNAGSGSSSEKKKNKFLKYPEARTQDLEVIKMDIGEVKDCDLETFRELLDKHWKSKAQQLYAMATDQNEEWKTGLFRESKRLKEINYRISALSVEQEDELQEWFNSFAHTLDHAGKSVAEVQHILKECVKPWAEPFIYSRITRQGDLFLTLVVALHDFARVTNEEFAWRTPYILPQYQQRLNG